MKLLLVLLLAASPQGISITLNPRILMAGGSTWLTCRVTPDTRNRSLVYGMNEFSASQRELQGEQSPITWGPILFQHVPCGVTAGYCIVLRNDGSRAEATAPLVVSGCEDNPSLYENR